jgi:hypothetical protein
MRSLVSGSSIWGGSQWRSSLSDTPASVPPIWPPRRTKRSKLRRKGPHGGEKPSEVLSVTYPVQ